MHFRLHTDTRTTVDLAAHFWYPWRSTWIVMLRKRWSISWTRRSWDRRLLAICWWGYGCCLVVVTNPSCLAWKIILEAHIHYTYSIYQGKRILEAHIHYTYSIYQGKRILEAHIHYTYSIYQGKIILEAHIHYTYSIQIIHTHIHSSNYLVDNCRWRVSPQQKSRCY